MALSFFSISFHFFIIQMSCQKIISGGQTGVDRGFLDAALEKGFCCGGWCPPERMAEDGRIGERYHLTELATGGYEERTVKNIAGSDGTLVLTGIDPNGGTLLTIKTAEKLGKPYLVIHPPDECRYPEMAVMIAGWIRKYRIGVLNCAGPRESEWKEGHKAAFTLGRMMIGAFRGEELPRERS